MGETTHWPPRNYPPALKLCHRMVFWNARFSPPAIDRKELLENAYCQRGSSSEFVCWPIEFLWCKSPTFARPRNVAVLIHVWLVASNNYSTLLNDSSSPQGGTNSRREFRKFPVQAFHRISSMPSSSTNARWICKKKHSLTIGRLRDPY